MAHLAELLHGEQQRRAGHKDGVVRKIGWRGSYGDDGATVIAKLWRT